MNMSPTCIVGRLVVKFKYEKTELARMKVFKYTLMLDNVQNYPLMKLLFFTYKLLNFKEIESFICKNALSCNCIPKLGS